MHIFSSRTGDWLKTLKPLCFCGIAIATKMLPVFALQDVTSPLDQLPDKGEIGNREYAAAKTCGDGACALHCIFGAISAGGTLKLECSGVCAKHASADMGRAPRACDDAYE